MIIQAILQLVPQAQFAMHGDDYEGIQWFDERPKPTWEEIQSILSEVTKKETDNLYKIKRSMEYPKASDYLDAFVKGDQEQMQAYIDACLAVKAKYPKPSNQ